MHFPTTIRGPIKAVATASIAACTCTIIITATVDQVRLAILLSCVCVPQSAILSVGSVSQPTIDTTSTRMVVSRIIVNYGANEKYKRQAKVEITKIPSSLASRKLDCFSVICILIRIPLLKV